MNRLLAAIVASLLLGACSAHHSDDSHSAAPWVASCFSKAGSESTSDRAYVGLTRTQAIAMANYRDQQLVLVGVGEKCIHVSDDVNYRQPVAVAFSTGTPKSGVPSHARIVFATSDTSAKYEGWGLH